MIRHTLARLASFAQNLSEPISMEPNMLTKHESTNRNRPVLAVQSPTTERTESHNRTSLDFASPEPPEPRNPLCCKILRTNRTFEILRHPPHHRPQLEFLRHRPLYAARSRRAENRMTPWTYSHRSFVPTFGMCLTIAGPLNAQDAPDSSMIQEVRRIARHESLQDSHHPRQPRTQPLPRFAAPQLPFLPRAWHPPCMLFDRRQS